MNYKVILKSLGFLLIIESLLFIPSVIVGYLSSTSSLPSFYKSILVCLSLGLIMFCIGRKSTVKHQSYKNSVVIVGLGWIMITFAGGLPFYFSGYFDSVINAIFESVSGFTTTGASILTDIESVPKDLLFWRSFTHWIGGMGILVLVIAVLPSRTTGNTHLVGAESSGISDTRVLPKIKQSAKNLYLIYIGLTILLIIFLLFGGMNIYDSLVHSFGTVGTGGFSNKNLSIGSYNSVYIETVITIFMILSGINFSLYFFLITKKVYKVITDSEVKVYIGVIVSSILFVTLNLYYTGTYKTITEALRYGSFQVASMATCTGFATVDSNLWPTFSKFLLLFLMIIGGSVGSTAGGIKQIRFLIVAKALNRNIQKRLTPNRVQPIIINQKTALTENIVSDVISFCILYLSVISFSVIIVSLDGKDMVTSFSAVISVIGGVGPGFEMVGTMGNYEAFSVLSKSVLIFDMLLGRLEIIPILILLKPSVWKKG